MGYIVGGNPTITFNRTNAAKRYSPQERLQAMGRDIDKPLQRHANQGFVYGYIRQDRRTLPT